MTLQKGTSKNQITHSRKSFFRAKRCEISSLFFICPLLRRWIFVVYVLPLAFFNLSPLLISKPRGRLEWSKPGSLNNPALAAAQKRDAKILSVRAFPLHKFLLPPSEDCLYTSVLACTLCSFGWWQLKNSTSFHLLFLYIFFLRVNKTSKFRPADPGNIHFGEV